jgi:cyclophilin family peptidyl-prolyl cis-trans isomerase/HEAT repeat protein
MRLRNSIIFFILIANSAAFGQKLSNEEKEILMLQDTRSLGENNKLLNYLNSDSKNLVIRTLYTLANIADSNTIDDIGKVLLSNGDAQIREYAAFALGQIPVKRSAEYLSKALDAEQNTEVLCRVLNSIGRTGDEEDLNRVSGYQTENDSVRACIAMSIARFGMRKIKNEQGFRKLDSLVDRSFHGEYNVDIIKNVSYAYARIGDEKFLNVPNRVDLEFLLTASVSIPEARMWTYSAMGKKKGLYRPLIFERVLAFSEAPPSDYWIETDWRARVNALNTISNFDYKIQSPHMEVTISRLLSVIDGDNESISLLVIQDLGKIFEDTVIAKKTMEEIEKKLKSILESTYNRYSYRQKSEAAIALATIFKDKAKAELIKVYKNANDWDVKTGIIRAFGKFEDGKIYRTVRGLISEDVQKFGEKNPGSTNALASSKQMLKLYRAFIEMLTSLDKKVNDEDKNNIRLIYSEFLSSKDPILTDLTLTALMDSMYIKYRPETQKIIMFDYEELKLPNDADVMQLYIQAMGELKMNEAIPLLEKDLKSESYDIAKASADALMKITGNDYESQITAQRYKTDFDWEYIEKLNDKRFVVMKTNKGEIKLELFPETAPFTVQGFLKLAEKHYYDSTVFHRVVPNFVIQGGDPTGTGYSGPGYSIRSEFSPLTYETGYLGMASSGKDTEGSQFFITHSPQPHLDGRYTIFGKVTEGMDVVDRIQVGDILLQLIMSNE